MRLVLAGLIALFVLCDVAAAKIRPADLRSNDAVLRWINSYRQHPDANSVPEMMRTLSRNGAFNDTERAGVYVGFFAGVLASNGDKAPRLIEEALEMREADRWTVVRAIAYSGLPDWKFYLYHYAPQIPGRRVMIERYIGEMSPRLDQLATGPGLTQMEKARKEMHLDSLFGKPATKTTALEPNADVLDTLWGYYFATGSYGPVMRIIALMEWADDRDDVERLMLGATAKYTLATNALRDENLLAMIKNTARAKGQPKKTVAALNEVAEASENVDTGKIRKEVLAAANELRTKGPASKRQTQWLTFLGQTAIAGGCLAAAMTGHVELGLPCVIGGAASSAVLNAANNAP
jgi:hypothetical protein